MATASKGQGLLVSLIVFVVLTVAMCVTSFLFYQETTKLKTQLASAQDQAKKANSDKDLAIRQRDSLKLRIGHDIDYGTDEATSPLIAKITEDLQKYNITDPRLDAASLNYTNMLTRVNDVKVNTETMLQQKTAANAKLQKDFEDSRRALTAERDQHDRNAQEKTADLAQVQAEVRTKIAGLENEVQTFAKDATKATNDKIQGEQDFGNYRTLKEREMKGLTTTIQTYKDAQDKLLNMGEPVGSVVSVQYDTVNKQVYVTIDIGEADRLPLQTTFSVWAPDKNASVYWKDKDKRLKDDAAKQFEESSKQVNLAPRPQGGPKAFIEIVELGARQSIGRVTMNNTLDPIAPPDRLFSPIWTRGAQKHVALVGKFDMTGKGTNDRKLLMEMIKGQGGVIDLWVDDEGHIQPPGAELTPRTNWLILGSIPEGLDPMDPDSKSAGTINTVANQLKSKAKDLAVDVIDQNKFFDYVGYAPKSREHEVDAYTGGPEPKNRFANPDETSRPSGLPTKFEQPGVSTRPTGIPGKASKSAYDRK